MKLFELTVRLIGETQVEDPKCPWYWRGSGVEYMDVPASQRAGVIVHAESEENAAELAEQYEYEADPKCELSCVDNVVIEGFDMYDSDKTEESVESVDFFPSEIKERDD